MHPSIKQKQKTTLHSGEIAFLEEPVKKPIGAEPVAAGQVLKGILGEPVPSSMTLRKRADSARGYSPGESVELVAAERQSRRTRGD